MAEENKASPEPTQTLSVDMGTDVSPRADSIGMQIVTDYIICLVIIACITYHTNISSSLHLLILQENWKKYDTFFVNVDPDQDYKATEIKLCNFSRPQ